MRTEEILLEVASRSIGPLPKSYGELHRTVWATFKLGQQYTKLKSEKYREMKFCERRFTYEVNLLCQNIECKEGSMLVSGPEASPGEAERQVEKFAIDDGWQMVEGRWLCPDCKLEAER